MNPQAFRRAMGRAPQRIPFAKLQPATPKPLPREALFHFWHPERDGVEQAPERIAVQLARIHRDLRIVRPPANAPVASRAWVCWYRKPEITHELSPGWMLFFVWQQRAEGYDEDKGSPTVTLTPLSLDDPRLIANIFRFSTMGDFKSAEAHFRGIVDQMQAEKQTRAKADQSRRDDIRKDFWQSTKIKNIGHGSKFASHHDGSVVPTKGDIARQMERGTRDDPGYVTEEARRARERRKDRRPR